MPLPRIFNEEPCPLEGYEDLRVRVLANATDAEWANWALGNLGIPGCPECAKLARPPRGKRAPKADEGAPRYCEACAAARARYGQAIVTFYGPTLLGEDVSTPERALALFDRDDLLPSEIVIWLQFVPGQVRERRQEAILGNLNSSLTTPAK